MNNPRNRKPYTRYLDAKCIPTPDGKYTPDALYEMQQAMLDALRSDDPLPDEMRRDLAFAFENLCAGITYDLLTPTKRPGGRKAPIGKHMQQNAIRYLRWVEDGHILDASPIPTVAQSFGVEERTVRNWRKSWRNRPIPSLDDAFDPEPIPKFIQGTGNDDCCLMPSGQSYKMFSDADDDKKVSGPTPSEMVTELMKIAGKAYRRFIPKPKQKGL